MNEDLDWLAGKGGASLTDAHLVVHASEDNKHQFYLEIVSDLNGGTLYALPQTSTDLLALADQLLQAVLSHTIRMDRDTGDES